MDGRDTSSALPISLPALPKSAYLGRARAAAPAPLVSAPTDATVLQIFKYAQELRGRVDNLGEQSQPASGTVLEQALTELNASCEELRVAEEELRRQSDALAKARRALEQEHQSYEDFLQLTADGFVTTDANGVVREVNSAGAAILNISPEFLVGKPLTSFVARTDCRTFLKALRETKNEAWGDRLELRLRRRHSEAPFFAEVIGRAVRGDRGAAPMIRWGIRDISARKEAELVAWEEQLAERVSLRTAELEQQNGVQARLIYDLLDASRVLSGNAPMIFEAVELGRMVKAAVEAAQLEVDPGIDLSAVGFPGDLQVLGDAARLDQVIRTLVTKALGSAGGAGPEPSPDGTNPNGTAWGAGPERSREGANQGGAPNNRVEVRVERDGTCALLVVTVGDRIPDDTALNTGLPPDAELMLPHAIVDLHGGTLRSVADSDGRFCHFVVRLPMGTLPNDVPEPDGPSVEDISIVELDGVRALVVDADEQRCELLMNILRERGAEVTAASSTSEALLMVEDWRPDVLISDVGLPDHSGYDLIRRVRRLGADKGGSVPAIALTGYADLEASRRALLAGYQVHVAKPIDASLFSYAVANVAGVPIAELSS